MRVSDAPVVQYLIVRHIIAVVILVSSCFSLAHAVEIDWHIRNRFRAFDYLPPSNTHHFLDGRLAKTSADWFDLLAPPPRNNQEAAGDTASWLKTVIASGGSPYGDAQRLPWDEDAQAYRSDFVELPPSIAIEISLVHADTIPAEAVCKWLLDAHAISTGPCHQHQYIDIPPAGGQVDVRQGNQSVATAHLQPRLRIVLGLGDSYSAGEGSPDVPTVWDDKIKASDWLNGVYWDIESHIKQPAQWWSPRCNRSFYSFENMTALRMAAEDPHSVISFVHLACAGAEIIDGMLSAQRLPPGHPPKCKRPSQRVPKGKLDASCDEHVGQLEAAVHLLCRNPSDVIQADSSFLDSLRDTFKRTFYAQDQIERLTELKICRSSIRPIDTVLITMGGNDAGFGGVIATILVPAKGRQWIGDFLVNSGRKEVEAVCLKGLPCSAPKAPTAEQRIQDLPARFTALDSAMRTLLKVEASKIVIAQYPNPLHGEGGKLCGDLGGNNNNPWYAARTALPAITFPKRWEFNVLDSEAEIAEHEVILPLDKSVKDTATNQHWSVAMTNNVFDRRGWCVGDFKTLGAPKSAHTWDGYADHTRLIRTSDDSFLTQHPFAANRSDGLSGSFHPNAFGYAAIADGVLRSVPIPVTH